MYYLALSNGLSKEGVEDVFFGGILNLYIFLVAVVEATEQGPV